MKDGIMLGAIVILMPFAFIWFFSLVFRFFVALGAPPMVRASWIVGLGYLLTSAIVLFGIPLDGWERLSPIAALPGAAIAFWLHYRTFKAGWIENSELEGLDVELDDEDWRNGLVRLLAFIVLGGILAAAKLFLLN